MIQSLLSPPWPVVVHPSPSWSVNRPRLPVPGVFFRILLDMFLFRPKLILDFLNLFFIRFLIRYAVFEISDFVKSDR